MTGFTGVDLVDNAIGILVLVGLAAGLTDAFGIEGTAAAAAISIAGLNVVRLVQVRRRLGIQPYDRPYAGLVVPAGAALALALATHAVLSDRAWWVSLAGTAAAALVVYLALLPLVLPADERAVLRKRLRSVQA